MCIRDRPEELAEMMAEVGKIPASVLDRLAEQVKPCKENAANCRYTSVNAPKCEAREEFLKIRVELKTQQLAFYLSLIHISEPTRLLSISYAVFCLKKKKKK
eukprot:TRINITY_DN12445_c0_g1_i13.p1 TRINITY_DN12445_c0_g1~~TRINITY_DN12445_c0_g1_i13.p1  ORF type:complete len:102 (+),score=48.91 TRINITY_DN12445_c0_g1_i13:200-505(+)